MIASLSASICLSAGVFPGFHRNFLLNLKFAGTTNYLDSYR